MVIVNNNKFDSNLRERKIPFLLTTVSAVSNNHFVIQEKRRERDRQTEREREKERILMYKYYIV